MSSCIVMEFGADGEARDEGFMFRNWWGGAPRIWHALYEKWLKRPENRWDSWLSDGGERLWGLAEDERLPEYQKAVLLATFDGAVVYRRDFKRFAGDLRTFAQLFPTEGADHLEGWAMLALRSTAEAIAFWRTTKTENPWQERCGKEVCEGEEHRVRLGAREDAFSVY